MFTSEIRFSQLQCWDGRCGAAKAPETPAHSADEHYEQRGEAPESAKTSTRSGDITDYHGRRGVSGNLVSHNCGVQAVQHCSGDGRDTYSLINIFLIRFKFGGMKRPKSKISFPLLLLEA
jgi:hypothetical protein